MVKIFSKVDLPLAVYRRLWQLLRCLSAAQFIAGCGICYAVYLLRSLSPVVAYSLS
jgi:hypothetical protein